jgi:hypothetical protein
VFYTRVDALPIDPDVSRVLGRRRHFFTGRYSDVLFDQAQAFFRHCLLCLTGYSAVSRLVSKFAATLFDAGARTSSKSLIHGATMLSNIVLDI